MHRLKNRNMKLKYRNFAKNMKPVFGRNLILLLDFGNQVGNILIAEK